jgi:hypothetical protein
LSMNASCNIFADPRSARVINGWWVKKGGGKTIAREAYASLIEEKVMSSIQSIEIP